MKSILFTVHIFFSINVVQSQVLPDYSNPVIENFSLFLSGNYDTSLIIKHHIAACKESNSIIYFDILGRIEKNVIINADTVTLLVLYSYDKIRNTISTESSGTFFPTPFKATYLKTYENGRLIKDSLESGGWCRHIGYNKNGQISSDTSYGIEHSAYLVRNIEHDVKGNMSGIIVRQYEGRDDIAGKIISARKLFYNDRGCLIREEESIQWQGNDTKNVLCPNAGSAVYRYNENGKLAEVIRENGPSQKITYLNNGLIAEIVTHGKICNGEVYNRTKKSEYYYR